MLCPNNYLIFLEAKVSKDTDIKKIILSTLEGKKKPDAIDGFFLQIEDRLWALPLRKKAQFEIKMLSLLFELEQDLALH